MNGRILCWDVIHNTAKYTVKKDDGAIIMMQETFNSKREAIETMKRRYIYGA